MNDVARIYSITVNNAVDGQSSGCRVCALSAQSTSSACVPCPPGHYIDTHSNQCKECPSNTYLVSHASLGSEACKACGPASRSDEVCLTRYRPCAQAERFLQGFLSVAFQDHRLCYSDCHFTYTDGNLTLTYNFSLLGATGSLMNGPSFTSKGTKYFHLFNISLCGGQVSKRSGKMMLF